MKYILVTGGAQGIGRAVVENLIKQPDVSIIVIDKQRSQFIEDSLKSNEQRFLFYQQDVAQRESLSVVLDEIASKHKLAGVVNNAGEIYFEKWDNLKMNTWDRTLAVNVTAPLFITHTLRDVLESNSSVVNIASVDGLCAAFDSLAYAASKSALINLTKSLAAVMGGKKIRVNAIAPGWVETEMTKNTLPTEASSITPLGRNAQAYEIANVVDFLLSDKASFINGQTIIVDGGLTSIDYSLYVESKK